MGYKDKRILRDADENPIPQIWSDSEDDYLPYTGEVTINELPLPTEAATEAKQNSIISELTAVKANVAAIKTEVEGTLNAVNPNIAYIKAGGTKPATDVVGFAVVEINAATSTITVSLWDGESWVTI